MIDQAGLLLMSISSAMLPVVPEGVTGQAQHEGENGDFASLLAMNVDSSMASGAPDFATPTTTVAPAEPAGAVQSQSLATTPELPVLPVNGNILPDALPVILPVAQAAIPLPEAKPAAVGNAEKAEPASPLAPMPAPLVRSTAHTATKTVTSARQDKTRSKPATEEDNEPVAQGSEASPDPISTEVSALPSTALPTQAPLLREDGTPVHRQSPDLARLASRPVVPPTRQPHRAKADPSVNSVPAEVTPPKAPEARTLAQAPASVLAARLVIEPSERPAAPRPASPIQFAREAPDFTAASPQQTLPSAVPQATPFEPAFTAHSPSQAETPVDFTQLVDRLVAAREAAGPAEVKVSLEHGRFGKVTLAFAPDDTGLNVTMASANPEFMRAVEAASPAPAPVSSTPEATNNAGQQSRQGDPAMAFAQGQSQGQSTQRQQSTEPRPHAQRGNPSTPGDEARPEAERRRGIFA